jgi:hypothetical protein
MNALIKHTRLPSKKIHPKFAKIETTHDEKFNEEKFPKYLVK